MSLCLFWVAFPPPPGSLLNRVSRYLILCCAVLGWVGLTDFLSLFLGLLPLWSSPPHTRSLPFLRLFCIALGWGVFPNLGFLFPIPPSLYAYGLLYPVPPSSAVSRDNGRRLAVYILVPAEVYLDSVGCCFFPRPFLSQYIHTHTRIHTQAYRYRHDHHHHKDFRNSYNYNHFNLKLSEPEYHVSCYCDMYEFSGVHKECRYTGFACGKKRGGGGIE